MSMSSNKIRVSAFPSLATRESGQLARETALKRLESEGSLVLDFTDAHPTPSFADEFIGRLAEVLGASKFRASIRIEGADAEARPLLQQVIARRLNRTQVGSSQWANSQRTAHVDR
jgi:hypothetical protein